MCRRSLVISFEHAQAMCLSSVLILWETTCPCGRCFWSHWVRDASLGNKTFCPLVNWQYNCWLKAWTWKSDRPWLNLGLHRLWAACLEAGYLPPLSLGFLDSTRMMRLNLPYQMAMDLKRDSMYKALSTMPGPGGTKEQHITAITYSPYGLPKKHPVPRNLCKQVRGWHQRHRVSEYNSMANATRRLQGPMRNSKEYISANFSKPCKVKQVIWSIWFLSQWDISIVLFPPNSNEEKTK